MTRSDAPTEHDQGAPLIFRVASVGRRMLPRGGVSLIRRSPAASRLRRVLSEHAPEGVRRVEVCGGRLKGASLYIDLSCEKYYWLGTHEELVQDAIAAQVGPGFTVYDVGAHAGFFTLLASRLAGGEGRVYAFEPRPDNVERLRRNVEANDAQNVEVVAVAASDRDGEAAFVMHDSTLQGRLAGETERSASTVRTATIDALVREGMTPPDVVKIDVEGAEGAVIRGAARTIDLHRPALLMEVHSREAGQEVADAMPCRYAFRDLATGVETGAPETAAHYLALPAVGPGRAG